MAILTGVEIEKQHKGGRIVIEPYREEQLNLRGNSYDVRIGDQLAVMVHASTLPGLAQYSLHFRGNGEMMKETKAQCRGLYDSVANLVHTQGGWVPAKDSLPEQDEYDEDWNELDRPIDPANPPELFTYDLMQCPVLFPGVLYLGHTLERAGSDYYCPHIHGKSSLARLGLSIHETAGFGEVGFKAQWTLEMTVVQPMTLRPDMRIGQVEFETVEGEIRLYQGNYKAQQGPTGSKMGNYFKDGKPI